MLQRAIVLFASVLALFHAPVLYAQSAATAWPERSITLIVPSVAGGSTDMIARTLADGLSTQLGQTVVVENRSGAAGTIGLQTSLRAPDDGYTFVLGYTSAVVSTQFTMKDLPFNVQRDFQAVAGVAFTDLVMNVNASIPVTNPQELVTWMKNQSGSLAYSSYGEGSYSHLVSHYLGRLYGLNAVHIPYKGEQPMMMAVAGNDVMYAVSSLQTGKTLQDTGKTRIVGLLADARSAFSPALPTFKESGVTDPVFQMRGWYGLLTHKSVAQPIVQKMERAAITALNSPLVQQRLASLSIAPWGGTAQAFEDVWYAQIPLYRDMLRAAGVTIYE